MKRTIFFALLLLSLISCEEKCPRIGNKDLERSILEYDSIVKSKNNRPYMLEVYVKNLNDSVKRFNVSYSLSTDFSVGSNVVLYKVKDKEVLFHFTDGVIPDSCHQISEEKYINLMKELYPEEYKRYQKTGYVTMCINDDGCFILTFYKDKLVGKTLQYYDGSASTFYKIGNKYFIE